MQTLRVQFKEYLQREQDPHLSNHLSDLHIEDD